MEEKTKLLLDSGDPDEYRQLQAVAKANQTEIWGSTTNPSLIAKKLAGKKISQKEAFELQKKIVLEILSIVPGAVSAEVYADEKTLAQDMIAQGREIATWSERVMVKLPTTLEGFKARTTLRMENIKINNTLVFSQEQIFAICLHEKIMRREGAQDGLWPSFISPFVGRLDDMGENGMDLVTNGMKMKQTYEFDLWMLSASLRKPSHIQKSIAAKSELITAPEKVYTAWFENDMTLEKAATALKPIPYWTPSDELLSIASADEFMDALSAKRLIITHPLTDKGITKFAEDWQAIIAL